MSVQRIAALGVSVMVLAAGVLTGGTAGAAGQAAARETAAGTVSVSITAAHNVVMPTTIQPGVNQFRVTTEAKSSAIPSSSWATCGSTIRSARVRRPSNS